MQEPLDEISQLINQIEIEKLDLVMKIESDQARFIQNVPTIQKELAAIKQQIQFFNKKLDAEKLNHSNDSFQDLVLMEKVYGRLKQTKSLLKDADNWNTVQMEMESLFVSKNYDQACERLLAAKQSLELISVSQHYGTRKELLDSLIKQFLELLASDLGSALEQHNAAQVKLLSVYFDKFNRSDMISEIYFEYNVSKFHVYWKLKKESVVSDLINFFEKTLIILEQEFEKVCKMFSNSREEVNLILYKILSKLTPSLSSTIIQIANADDPLAVLNLVEVYQIAVLFGATLESWGYGTEDQGDENNWSILLFNEFLPFQKRYEYFEKNYLEFQTKQIFTSSKTVQEKLDALIDLSYSILERYTKFTFRLGFVNLDGIIDDVFSFGCRLIDEHKNMPRFVTQGQAGSNKFQLPENYEATFLHGIELLKQSHSFYVKIDTFRKYSDKERLKDIKIGSHMDTKAVCEGSGYLLKELHGDHQFAEPHDLKSITLILDLITNAQISIIENLLLPIKSLLEYVPSFAFWGAESGTNIEDRFSLSPSTYVTTIAEHILTLPQQFDPFIQDESISFALDRIPYSKDAIVSPQDPEFDVTFVWIICLVRKTEMYYSENILKIKRLSATGKRQLIADVTYFRNVMAALEIEISSELSSILCFLERNGDESSININTLVIKKMTDMLK